MSGSSIALLMGLFMVIVMALRVPVGITMFLTGGIGYVWVSGLDPFLAFLKNAPYGRFSLYDLSVVPLFLLMGQFATHGGLSRALFKAGNAFIGHWRGGMAMAGVASCAGFGAICGSSLATAATMAHVVLPELERHKYKPSLAAGSLAAGGTLGILIPPSVPLVIYGILAEQNIAKLFLCAFVPGVLAALGYMLVIAIITRIDPELAGPGSAAHSWKERIETLVGTWPVLLSIIVIYLLLGCVMDSLSMILLTVPIFLPILLGMDYWGLSNDDKSIWFAIVALVVMEVGLITPPVGMNVYIINGVAKDIPMKVIFRGVMPFLAWDVARIGLLILFPSISLIALRVFG